MWVPLVRKDKITWWHPRGLLSPSIFLGVTHAEWIENSGVFILFTLCSAFHCGTNGFVPGLCSGLSWSVGHLSTALFLLPLSYDLSSIYFIYSSTHPWNFFKGKHLGLWIGLVLRIHDLEDRWEETRGPYPPFSWFTNLKINRLSASSCILCDWLLTS